MEKLKTVLAVFGAIVLVVGSVLGGLFYYGMDCMQVGVSGQHLWEIQK